MSEAAATFFGKESVPWNPFREQAHWKPGLVEEATRGVKTAMTATAPGYLDMEAQDCMARASAASNAREDVRCYCLDGRCYAPVYEALLAPAGLVDETCGNNIKRMQDEVNFLRRTYENRVSRTLNSKNRKVQIFLPGTCVYEWRMDTRDRERDAALLVSYAQKPGGTTRKRDPPVLLCSTTRSVCMAQSRRTIDEGQMRHEGSLLEDRKHTKNFTPQISCRAR